MVMMMMLKAGIRGAPPLPSVHVRPQPFTEVFAPAAHYSGPPPSQPKLARTSTILFHFLSSKSDFQKLWHQQPRPTLLANPGLHALEQFSFHRSFKKSTFHRTFCTSSPLSTLPKLARPSTIFTLKNILCTGNSQSSSELARAS